MSSSFAYATVDFGDDNTDSDVFRAHIQVEVGQRDIARRRFSFPGVDAEYARHLGVRGQSNRWYIDMVATDVAHLLSFESSIGLLEQFGGTAALTERGVIYPRAYCEAFRRIGPRVRLASPWAWAQRYQITWRILP